MVIVQKTMKAYAVKPRREEGSTMETNKVGQPWLGPDFRLEFAGRVGTSLSTARPFWGLVPVLNCREVPATTRVSSKMIKLIN
jgi:hypothetical protein